MASPILPIDPSRLTPLADLPARTSSGGAGFQQVFNDVVGGVERSRQAAARSVESFLAGEGEELHQTVLATQRAELAFELFLEMRNKVVQAYQEIMRMQI